jgi:hypothetical protein
MTTIMRLVLAAAALAAALCFDVPASRAGGNAPWCAVVSVGAGDVIWDCHYRSIEECRPNVIAGNRGFCNVNPARSSGWYAPTTVPPRKHRKRHVRVGEE